MDNIDQIIQRTYTDSSNKMASSMKTYNHPEQKAEYFLYYKYLITFISKYLEKVTFSG